MPVLVAVTALVSTFAVWRYITGAVEAQQRERFSDVTRGHRDDLRARLALYSAMLRAGRGFIEALERDPSAREFRAFVVPLDLERRPGIQGVGWSKALRPEEVGAHVAAERAAGRPGYGVWPEGPRALYSSIVHLEPADWRNRRAIGFDMYSEPRRREAMSRAADTGELAATRRVELVQEAGTERQPGFLIYLPVYAGRPADVAARRAALRGWIYAPFRVVDLLRAIGPTGAVDVAVYDGAEPSPAALLYQTSGDAFERPSRASTERFEIAGNTWTLRYAAGATFASRWERILPKGTLASGLVLAALLFWMTRNEARARRRAELAAGRAAFLAESGTLLAGTLDTVRTLPEVARLAAERVTDACVILVNEPEGPQWTVGHRDVAVARRLEDALRASGLSHENDQPLAAALRERRPQIAQVAGVNALSVPPGVLAAVRDAGLHQALTVPLLARGEPLGSITFLSRWPLHHFEPAEVALAEDLARIVVAAIDTSRLYARAQDALRDRDDFLSIASHELKTPLTSLLLQSETLRNSARRGEPEAVMRKADVIRRNVERLSRLVASLLDLSRIAAGQLEIELEEVELAALTRDVASRFEDEAERAGCALVVDTPGPIVGRWDPLRLDQVITNLLSNAIKYGPGRPVEIRLRRAGDAALLSVLDRGIGISEADQRRIFGRFERAVSKRHYGGFGLGLWITRQVVETLGGEVRVESAPGEGSTFTVELRGVLRAGEVAES